MVPIDADNDRYLTNSSKLTYALLWFPKKNIYGVYRHETCRFRLLNFVLKMPQNSPTNICDFKKFTLGLYPRTPVKKGRRGKEGKRKGEGMKRRTGKEREGKKVGGRGRGKGNGTGEKGREKGGDGHY
jgi:hypothetical protein